MTKVIGVRFRNNGRMYYFAPGELSIQLGDNVIVETAKGTEFGDVVMGITDVEDEQVVQPLAPVMRIATPADHQSREENIKKEPEAARIAQEKITQHQLDMKLVNVEYAFNASKIVFYFTADERVDFRELVKDLASQFHTRIELRQIGVRDEAKMLGGLGPCGRPICCKEFLDDFRPVSIKMAKEQNLSLSPTKISGLCGRLMCCLQYEQCCYDEMKHLMPRTGKEIQTPDGIGIAMENNAITEKTRVKLVQSDGSFDFKWYHYTELAKPGDPVPQRRDAEEPTHEAEQKDFGQVYAAARRTQGETRRQTIKQAVKQEQSEKELEKAASDTVTETTDTSAPRPNHSRRHHRRSTGSVPNSSVPASDSQQPVSSKDGTDGPSAKSSVPHRRRHNGHRRPHLGNGPETPSGNKE